MEDCCLSNYGTFLQHFALRKFLSQHGYKTYRLPYAKEMTLHNRGWMKRLLSESVPHWIGDVLHILCIRRRGAGFTIRDNRRRNRKRKIFAQDWKRLIGAVYEPQSLDCSIRIYGSDQIWSALSGLELFPVEPPEDCRVVSYAVSGDWENARSNEWQQKAKQILPRFNAISVRENAGVELVRRLVDCDVVHAVDPTLLLERADYVSAASNQVAFTIPTLFCYLLNLDADGARLVAVLEDFAKANELALRICAVQGAERYVPDKYRIMPSPSEFLAAFRDARYVVTNSFHGTIFSVLFGKPFLSIMQVEAVGTKQNIRQRELLSELGLEDHLVEVGSEAARLTRLLGMSDRSDYVKGPIRDRIVQSKHWLLKQLSGEA